MIAFGLCSVYCTFGLHVTHHDVGVKC